MTLPNNFSSSKRKINQLTQLINLQKITIDVQKKGQLAVVTQLNKSTTVSSFKVPIEIETEWTNLTQVDTAVLDFNPSFAVQPSIPDLAEIPNQLYFAWQVHVKGIDLRTAAGFRHNYLFRFGTSEILGVEDLNFDDNIINMINFIQASDTKMDDKTEFIFHYGVFIENTGEGILENAKGLQAKLLLKYNPIKSFN